MRLQLTFRSRGTTRPALLGGLALAGIVSISIAAPATASAQAATGADLRSIVYQDSDRTTISTTTAAVRGAATDSLQLRARYLIDVVSTASVDVISAATDSFQENRHEAEAGVSWIDGGTTAGVTYIHSNEPDWKSHTVSAGGSRDLWDRRLTIAAGASLGTNAIGRADDANFGEELRSAGGNLSAAVVVSRTSIVSVNYSFNALRGYQASPYRFAQFMSPASRLALSGPETHPESRDRHALAVRHNKHLFDDTAVRSHLRLYADDWGVASVTAGAEYVVGFGDLDWSVRARGYLQSGADFYQDVYDERRELMTADRELSPFFDVFVGSRLAVRRGKLHADLRVDGFYFRYFDFARLPERSGAIVELGAGIDL